MTDLKGSDASENNGKTITIYIDDVPYQVEKDNNLLSGVLSNKLKLPYFCWHPVMGSIGACRQCAVTQYQDENDKRGRMVMSCMTPVSDGMRIGLTDKVSAKFRKQVIAAMMTNHPHDCPVCTEGGECHLQDMTVMTGHSTRLYQGEKRTFTNQYLGELVAHEMNRCITCYRCVRFYKDYAGGKDFDVFGSSNHVYFGRQDDGILASAFSGNLVEVCPTGVFTNKPFSQHYTRKWDLQSAASVCSHCSIGCNISIGERYGSIRRVVNRYNHNLNAYFLCDRGRFGLGFVNTDKRIRTIEGVATKVGEPSIGRVNEKSLTSALQKGNNEERFIGIGSARASIEGNRLLQYLVGKENFSCGYTNIDMQLAVHHKQLLAQYPQESLAGIENRTSAKQQHDLVLIIGENIEQSAPRLALSVHQVLKNAAFDKAADIGVHPWQDAAVKTYARATKTALINLQVQPTEFDQDALHSLILSPDKLVEALKSINQILAGDKTFVEENHKLKKGQNTAEPLTSELAAITSLLSASKKPLIVSGTSLKSVALLKEIEKIMASLACQRYTADPEIILVAEQCNSVGCLTLLDEHTLSIEQVLQRLIKQKQKQKNEMMSLLILEQDLVQLPLKVIKQLRQHCHRMIVLDHSQSRLTELADIVLPVACVSESAGHFVNYQGLVQAFYPAHCAQRPILVNWQWLNFLAKKLFNKTFLKEPAFNEMFFKANKLTDASFNLESLHELHHYFASHGEAWAVQLLQQLSPQSGKEEENAIVKSKDAIAQQTHRVSGRTAQFSNVTIHEPQALKSKENYLNFSMESDSVQKTYEQAFTWSPSWNSNQAILQSQQQVNGELTYAVSENYLTFVFNDHIEKHIDSLWSIPSVYEETFPEEVTLVQNLPWFLVDEQAKTLPEFILMFAGDEVQVSSELAEKNHWQAKQILKIEINGISVFGRIKVNNELSKDVVLVSVFALPNAVNNIKLKSESLSIATNEDQVNFYQNQEQRYQKAKQEQQSILARLKSNDQHIPITLCPSSFHDDEQEGNMLRGSNE